MERVEELAANQRHLMLIGIIEDVSDDIFQTPNLLKKRKKLHKIQKLYFDEYLYYQGMTLFSKYVLVNL